jgi:hypothetical protein
MQEEYLVDAYGHEPRNNEELLMILDILDIPEATREKIAERCMGGMYWPNVAYCHEPRDDEELKKRLDILDIYGGAREMIIQWARYERLYWAAMKPSSMSDGNAAK